MIRRKEREKSHFSNPFSPDPSFLLCLVLCGRRKEKVQNVGCGTKSYSPLLDKPFTYLRPSIFISPTVHCLRGEIGKESYNSRNSFPFRLPSNFRNPPHNPIERHQQENGHAIFLWYPPKSWFSFGFPLKHPKGYPPKESGQPQMDRKVT